MKNFRDLKVWEKAHGVALACYDVTRTYPREEMFGLTSQIRRAGASVPANKLRDVVDEAMERCIGSCRWQWAPRTSLNTISYSPGIWDI